MSCTSEDYVIFTIFQAILGVFIINIFYTTELRARVEFPLADILLFSIMGIIAGSFWHAKSRTKKKIRALAQLEAKNDLSHLQGQFLQRFSSDLLDMNQRVSSLLTKHTNHADIPYSLQETYQNTLISAQELSDYLKGMKQFAHLNTQEAYQLEKKLISLEELFEKTLKKCEGPPTQSHLKIKKNFEKNSTIFTDELLFEPILFNILSNAMKYSPPDGLITIFVRSKNKKSLEIRITDEGPGIPKEFQKKIFEKFYRIKNDASHHIKGHGLGLYLSQFFAQKLKIPILIESKPGKGSSFSLIVSKGYDHIAQKNS